jgi:hypothetical protein
MRKDACMSLRRIVFVIVGAAIAMARPVTLAQSQNPAPLPAVGPVTVVPVQVTGDDASRFTLVVLADGYTAADMPAFRRDLDKHLNILWSLEPFRSYRNYFNVYAVEAASQDSGLTCDPLLLQETNMDPELRQRLQQRNTVFGLNFGGGCTNVNARGVTPIGNRNATVREYAAKATANPDQILIIGNSRTYGGIGGGIATSTGSNSLSPLITPHEIGHSLGRLTDEYTYSARGRAGGTYTGNEPGNVHTTLLTEEAMKAQQKKWWRWLGEPSESGGVIGRYEGGSGNTKGIWRPSKHSMMISLGYFFDQVSLEQMVRQISARVGLIAASTSTEEPVNRSWSIWIDPAHPVHHELTIEWKVGDRIVPNPRNLPYLDLNKAGLSPGEQQVTVAVVDPTEFVRDPEIRKTVLTTTKIWTVSAQEPVFRDYAAPATIDGSTQTTRAVGATDVVFIRTSRPAADVRWTLDGTVVADASGRMSFPLATRTLAGGSHQLSVTTETRPGTQGVAANSRRWTIDNTMPTVAYTLNKIIATLPSSTSVPASEPHSFMRDEFTMKLDPKDDQPGYVVAEFRVNGDGWHHYYGWPDAPPGTPFKFTARGTNIKELIYGSLSSEGLSPQPWEPREPGWGTHRIEYRAKDAAGNIGPAKAFRVTVMPVVACTATVTGPRSGDVKVDAGVTCLDAATVTGSVIVAPGATLVATNSKISGALTSTGAATVELIATSINGAMAISGTTERVTIFGVTVAQAATVSDNKTTTAPLVTGSTFKTTLGCMNNSVAPTNGGSANTAARGATGQCEPVASKF